MAARARAQPRSACRRGGSQRWAAQAPAPTATAWVAAASHRIESANVPWMSSAANASPAPTPATAGQTRRSLPTRSSSHVATRTPAGAYSNTSKSGTSPGRSGTERSSAVSSSVTGPPSTPGSRSDRNNGVIASHSVARAYAPARRNVGTPRRKCPSLARTTAVTSSAIARAPPQAPSVLVVTSTMLAVRTGENTCSPSTVALNTSATSVARQISARTLPEGELTTHTTPRPPNSAALRRPSMASRQPREGVNARASRWAAAARSAENSSCVTVATRTTATYARRAAMNRARGVKARTKYAAATGASSLGAPSPALLHSPGPMTTSVHDLSKLRLDRDTPPGVRRAFRRSLILAAVAAGLIAAVVLVVRRGSAVPVQTVVVTPLDAGAGAAGGATAVTANGYVVARTRASVSSKVPGRLVYLGVSEGSGVKSGDVIARLDTADYEAQVTQAQAGVANARAQLIEAQAERDQLQREAQRVQEIRAQNAQLVSQQDVDASESRSAQADARARAAAARIEAAEAALRFAQASLENTLIRAPFSGTVLRKEAEVGEVVAPSVGGGLTRGAVVTMADLRTLEVEVDVNEAYIARVHHGQPAKITLDAYPDTSFGGQVRQVVPTADRQRATVQVKVSILDHDPRILPEMGARVDFLEPERPATARGAAAPAPLRIRVPAGAVRERDGQSVVWLVRNGRLEPRVVQAGPVSGEFREIRSGLSGGELLLVGGVETPRVGLRVRATP